MSTHTAAGPVGTSDARIRPMRDDDVEACEQLSSSAFLELDRRTHQRGWPEPSASPPHRASLWHARTRHLLTTDPGGCWVVEVDGQVVGFATSLVRELMWILASYAVRPGLQGQGLGRALLDAALQHGRGCLRGMLNASVDPQALRRYALAGFRLQPQMVLHGTVDRAVLPVVRHVRREPPATATCSTRSTVGRAGPRTAPTTRCWHASCGCW